MTTLMNCVLVSAGACGGALSRYGLSEVAKQKGYGPAGICAINILGSFTLGAVFGSKVPGNAQLLVGTGFCGAFTTFSTYSVDVLKLAQQGQVVQAVGLVMASNTLSIAAAGVGMRAGAKLSLLPRIPLLRPPRKSS